MSARTRSDLRDSNARLVRDLDAARDRIAALEAKCDLLAASLKKADAERDAALSRVEEQRRTMVQMNNALVTIGGYLGAEDATEPCILACIRELYRERNAARERCAKYEEALQKILAYDAHPPDCHKVQVGSCCTCELAHPHRLARATLGEE